MTDATVRATVIIPTFNGEKYLERILESLSNQKVDGEYEILVIDSGSTDSTLEIVKRYPAVRLFEIPNSEFGHGKTRNQGVSLANGEFVAFLSHDAVPANSSWLHEMLAPFSIDESVVAVIGKQAPRPGCFPLQRFDIERVFAQFGPDFGTTIFYWDDQTMHPGQLDAVTFYSDVNSASRRAFLRDVIPYRDVEYAEDQMFGRDLINAGYRKAYAPRALVEHSNDVTFAEFGPRIFDETIGLRRIGANLPAVSLVGAVARAAKGSIADSKGILRRGAYSRRRALYWILVNPFYHLTKWLAFRRATRVALDDVESMNAGSLEHARRDQSAQINPKQGHY